MKIEITIYDADDTLLRVVNLRQLRVDRGGVAAIDSSILKAEHAYFSPKQITYVVKKQPSAGTLVLDQGSVSNATIWHGTFTGAERFTQSDIDEGKLHYVHRSTNMESASAGDEIIFDIYAPNVALNGVALRIGVMEREITLMTRNLTVDKGGARIIRPQHLSVKSNFDSATDDHSSVYVFTILRQPDHGWLEVIGADEENEEDDDDEEKEDGGDKQKHPEETLVTFRYKDVMDRKIRYVHDGSRSWRDEFTVNAKLADDSRTQSQPKTIYVKIKHSNEKGKFLIL